MFGLFKKSKPQAADATVTQEEGIPFYPNLIANLVDEHRQLERIRENIKSELDKGNLKAVSKGLRDFSTLLRNHLLTENMRLYIYLQQKVEGDDVSTQLVRSFRTEMNEIAKPVLSFIERYKHIDSMSTNELASFGAELQEISEQMDARIHREEKTLYPMYAANY